MPLGKGVRYRVKTSKGGKRVRLAFKGSRVVEAKNIDTGAKHTPAEFAADRKRSQKKKARKPKKTAVARFRARIANLKAKRKQ